MLEPDAPFYLAINHRRKPNDKVWYLLEIVCIKNPFRYLKEDFPFVSYTSSCEIPHHVKYTQEA